MSNPRFQFPGFALRTTRDTLTHEVEVGTIEDGGANVYVLEMLRSKELSHLPFVLASVSSLDRCLWQFSKEREFNGFNGVGLLALANDQPVIALVGRGRNGKVERVIPLSSLVDSQKLGVSAHLALKRAVGAFLGRDANVTPAEQRIVRIQESRENDAAYEARKQAREERARTILARGQISAFTSEGVEKHGTPALESEWPSLPKGTHVILVDSIGDSTKSVGKPLEAFRVLRESGRNPSKGTKLLVFASRPTIASASQPMLVRPTRTTFIERADDAFEVLVYATMDQIRAAQRQGLNSGTYAALMTKTPGTLQVFAVHHDRIDTVGNFVEYV